MSPDNDHWHPLGSAPPPTRNGQAILASGGFLTLGCDGLALSTDNGRHWRPLDAPLPDCRVLEGDVTAAWLFCAHGIAVSHDDGLSWTLHAVPDFINPADLEPDQPLVTVTAGVAVTAASGESYWTSRDDGASWHQVWPNLLEHPGIIAGALAGG